MSKSICGNNSYTEHPVKLLSIPYQKLCQRRLLMTAILCMQSFHGRYNCGFLGLKRFVPKLHGHLFAMQLVRKPGPSANHNIILGNEIVQCVCYLGLDYGTTNNGWLLRTVLYWNQSYLTRKFLRKKIYDCHHCFSVWYQQQNMRPLYDDTL